ncbi:MAG: hypothetical protein ACR2I2_17095 [Bryobacteraceae bacterium]
MEIVTVESIAIEAAIAAVRAIALRVAADCIDHGEPVPAPFAKVFTLA